MKSLVRVGTGVLVVALASLAYLNFRTAAELRTENERLHAQLAEADAQPKSNGAEDELARLRGELEQLPKLRGEVMQLRAFSNDLAKARQAEQQLRAEVQQLHAAKENVSAANTATLPASAVPSGAYVRRDSFAYAGYGSAESSLNSMLWALREGRSDIFINALSAESQAVMREKWGDSKTPENIAQEMRTEAQRTPGFQVLQSVPQADGTILLHVQVDQLRDDGSMKQKQEKMMFRQVGDEWKFSPEIKAPKPR
jgi:hypothetical protein